MPKLDELTNRVFGHWVVLHRAQRNSKSHHPYWHCKCRCGVEKDVARESLVYGQSTSCGCKFSLRPYESVYNILLKKNNGRGKPFPVDFTFEEFLDFVAITACHYCDLPVIWVRCNVAAAGTQSYNLDRKDPKIGYSKDNCVVCCARCNRAKSNHFTYTEWVQIGALIRSW